MASRRKLQAAWLSPHAWGEPLPQDGLRVATLLSPHAWGQTGKFAGAAHIGRVAAYAARQRDLFQPKTITAWLRGEGLLWPRHGGALWLLLTLELWLRFFLDGATMESLNYQPRRPTPWSAINARLRRLRL